MTTNKIFIINILFIFFVIKIKSICLTLILEKYPKIIMNIEYLFQLSILTELVKNSVKKFLKTFNESCHKASKKFYLYIAK